MTIDSVYLQFSSQPQDALILTPNRRLAAWLKRDFDQWMQAKGEQTWPQLNAIPLEQWLMQWYERICLLVSPEAHQHPRLLSSPQSAQLWKRIIQQHWDDSDDIEGLVVLSQQARNLALRWRWSDSQQQNAEKFEQQQFLHWHRLYRDLLTHENAIDAADLMSWVQTNGTDLRSGVARNVLLHGFNDPDEPALQQLCQWLMADGIRVALSCMPPRSATGQVVRFRELDRQFAHAIEWAIRQHDGRRRIGVVIPNLQPQRNRIRALCKHLWSLHPAAHNQHWSEAINITAAQRLSTFPLVSHLLLWLRGMQGELSLQEWSVLLTSPYVCHDDHQWLQRDTFIAQLREANHSTLYLYFLAERWEALVGKDATASWLTAMLGHNIKGKYSIARWLQWLNRFMAIVFSPQGRTLSSEEFQVRQRLLESVRQLTELDDLLGEIDFSRFRAELNSLLTSIQFQPQTDTAPIQVMGILEASGMAFDALWVCELEAVNWPQSLNPNPLLSRRLQRTLNMPGASPERELLYAQRLLTGFKSAADDVIFSWGEWQGDTEHTVSALVCEMPAVDAEDFSGQDIPSAEMLQYRALKNTIVTGPADEVGSPLPQQRARGGSGIIKSQSLCPFKAFAEYRLNLKSEDELAEGIKATDRGSFLHKVMESIWLELKDTSGLQPLLADEVTLDAWLNGLIEREMQSFQKSVSLRPKALYQLEKIRAFSVARQWLQQCDGKREHFSVVQVEKQRQLTVGGLELSLTVDRIDQLADQSYVIIDYKTSDKNQQAWLSERPEEPQLPLYTLLERQKTKGVLFGVLKPGALAYKGLLDTPDALYGGKKAGLKQSEDWESQMQAWETTLHRLAEEFRAGRAEVTPLTDAVCSYCHLAPVCRIKETSHDSD